ncbi:MAG: aquaporin [bacterium]
MTKASSVAGHMSRDHVVVFKMPSLRTELATMAMRRALAAEAVGVFLFVFLAAGTVLVTGLAERMSAARILVVALAHGLAFGLAVAGAGALSGGHLNPAITFGAVVARKMTAVSGVLYMAAQMLGAVAATLLLKLVVPNALANGLGAHSLATRLAPEAAVIVEMVLTCALVVAFFTTSTPQARHLAPVALGSVMVLAHLFAMGLTGASLNPARSFGPALISGVWTSHWIYWMGPLMGGVLGAMVWKYGMADTKNA